MTCLSSKYQEEEGMQQIVASDAEQSCDDEKKDAFFYADIMS